MTMSTPDALLTSFPLWVGLTPEGRADWRRGNASVREVMLNILLTNPGERLMRPEFGAGIRRFIHHPNTETTRALIADAARRALTRWEPRVTVDAVRALPDPEQFARVNLEVRYRLLTDGSPQSLDLTLDLG
jgi:phage baseplate assembly protein W